MSASPAIFAFLVEEEDPMLTSHSCAKDARFTVHHILSKAADTWGGLKGRVSAELVQAHLPPPADDVLVCVVGGCCSL